MKETAQFLAHHGYWLLAAAVLTRRRTLLISKFVVGADAAAAPLTSAAGISTAKGSFWAPSRPPRWPCTVLGGGLAAQRLVEQLLEKMSGAAFGSNP